MACFLLFGAFMDEFSEYSGKEFTTVDIATPEVLVGGLIGSMIIFYFTGLSIAAVGKTARGGCHSAGPMRPQPAARTDRRLFVGGPCPVRPSVRPGPAA